MRQHRYRLRQAVLAFSAMAMLLSPTAQAQEDQARKLLKAMSDYVGTQQSFSFAFQSSVEAVTKDFEKLEFVSSGTVIAQRPDKLHLQRTGGFADVELVFDGTTLTIAGRNLKAYAQVEAKGTLVDLAEQLADAGVDPPAADLLASDSYELLTDAATEIRHIGSAVVSGVECEYIAGRTPEIDWQLWIQTGDKPIPRRYVITSKHVVQGPQHTIEISDWKDGAAVSDGFAFTAPADFKKVDLSELEMIDELPSPTE